MKRLTAGMTVAAFAVASPVFADFVENFDGAGDAAGAALPAPWTGGFQFDKPLLVSPKPSGFVNTQGAHGPSGDWYHADRATGYDPALSVHKLSWKAKLSSADLKPRLTAGLGNAAGGTLFFEMRGTSPTDGLIEQSIDTFQDGWTSALDDVSFQGVK